VLVLSCEVSKSKVQRIEREFVILRDTYGADRVAIIVWKIRLR
jgi:hypothetical protein